MDKILVLDFGGQYNQLIARRVREMHVFSEIRFFSSITADEIGKAGYKGIILTGGPDSVYRDGAPRFDPALLRLGIPVLGICYGAQLMAYLENGKVTSAESSSEYGRTEVFLEESILFRDVPDRSVCWMSHTDFISEVPAGFRVSGHTAHCPCAAMCEEERKLYAVQFHPEVTHTEYGRKILSNFVFLVCGCSADWMLDDFIAGSIGKYREELRGKKILMGLSGGVDSLVAAILLHQAAGNGLTCVFVDHGMLRKNEGEEVEKTLKERFGLTLLKVDAKQRFLEKLKGVTEPEEKRKIIGGEFIRVFEETARSLGSPDVLGQGTIYPDVIESGRGGSAVIKSHHNVGGLPEKMKFTKIVEPLRDLFKDEVRETGIRLNIPEELVYRQPFPGPGLGVRIIGEVTEEKLDLLREADSIFREEIRNAGLQREISQYFAVLTDTRSVGVMGDARTYGYTVVLRAVNTDDFMTADWSRIPYDILDQTSRRITNEVKGITRVVYDITAKPPGTVEWE